MTFVQTLIPLLEKYARDDNTCVLQGPYIVISNSVHSTVRLYGTSGDLIWNFLKLSEIAEWKTARLSELYFGVITNSCIREPFWSSGVFEQNKTLHWCDLKRYHEST